MDSTSQATHFHGADWRDFPPSTWPHPRATRTHDSQHVLLDVGPDVYPAPALGVVGPTQAGDVHHAALVHVHHAGCGREERFAWPPLLGWVHSKQTPNPTRALRLWVLCRRVPPPPSHAYTGCRAFSHHSHFLGCPERWWCPSSADCGWGFEHRMELWMSLFKAGQWDQMAF